jgi:ubiquitin-like 1-activating enzyme E1 B
MEAYHNEKTLLYFLFSICRVAAMAGNIIPAIATTNAVVAGMVVLHALKVLQGRLDECQSVYLRLRPNPRGLIIVPERQLQPPNPKCYVCSGKPMVSPFT